MKQILDILSDKVGIKSRRTKNIARHVGWSLFYKSGSIIANFLLVPLTINYLNTENYGIWLTLSSFISWFSFFDIGLGNGLRNKFAKAKAIGNYEDAQAFVSTAYFTIGSISLGVIIVFLGINQYINWTQVFNTRADLKNELSLLLPIIFTFFGLQLTAKLVTSIYQANQNHSIESKIQFFVQTFSLLVIFFLTKTNQSSLLVYGSIFAALPVMILLFLNFFAFKTAFKRFKPKYSLWRMENLRDITDLGFKFFVVQIAALVIFSTDNFIITKILGPEHVVPYDMSYKYFSIVTIVYGIVIAPYWSSFSDAFAKNDYEWIKKSVMNIQKLWFVIPLTLIFMFSFSDWFYMIWVGDKIYVPRHLSLTMALFVLLVTFNMVYVNFINGVGKIKLQLYSSLVSVILNIPLSIFFCKYLDWGSTGVILATCFSLGYSVILRPVQYYKIINGRASGIWNK